MNVNFLTTYSLPVIIITVFVGTLSFVLDKFLFNKIKSTTRNYLTFFLAIILYFIYESLFVTKRFALYESTIYAGILIGSLSTTFNYLLNKISSKRSISDALGIIIESIIKEIIADSAIGATVISLEKLFASELDEKKLKEQIVNILALNAVSALTLEEYERVATLLIRTIKSLDENSKTDELR